MRASSTACDSYPCHNGATCVADLYDSTKYSCYCATGYTGLGCEGYTGLGCEFYYALYVESDLLIQYVTWVLVRNAVLISMRKPISKAKGENMMFDTMLENKSMLALPFFRRGLNVESKAL